MICDVEFILIGYDGERNREDAKNHYSGKEYDKDNVDPVFLQWKKPYGSAGTLSGWVDRF